MTPRVLVTEKEFHKGAEVFASAAGIEVLPAPADEGALAAEILTRHATAVIVGVERYAGPLYAALSETAGGGKNALIARFGVGYDGIDLEQAHTHGVFVTNTPGVLDQSVAEHTLWLIGALARRVTAGDATMRDGAFPAAADMEVAGKTLGIIGFGPIGRRVARAAHTGLDMRVLAADLLPMEALAKQAGSDPQAIRRATGVEAVEHDADAVIEQADVISLHLPALPATRHFIDSDRLARFRPGALLVNTARGALVDEVALYDALVSGQLSAALDVFEEEPYQPQAPGKDLRTLENVVLTPHVGSSTVEANHRMAQACVANVAAFASGRMEDLTRVPSRATDVVRGA
jgi:lactate dehydrogenase-like 2-hydroxyacid dehydrogenase